MITAIFSVTRNFKEKVLHSDQRLDTTSNSILFSKTFSEDIGYRNVIPPLSQ